MRRIATILLLFAFAANVWSQNKDPHLRSANRKYKEGKFEEALAGYLSVKKSDPQSPIVNFNLGDALYRSSRFEEAEDAFELVIAEGNDNALKQKAYYNKGVSLTKQNKLEESIEAYKAAVKIDPGDEDARINLQKALLELKRRMPPPEKNEEQKKQEQNEKEKQQTKSNLTQKQVEQLLKALQQREQQVQQKMQQRQRTAGKQEKDW